MADERHRPVRIAHLTTVDTSLRYLLLAQLEAAADAGEAVGISARGPHVEALTARGIGHRPLLASTRGMNLRADLRAAFELWRLLRRECFDVLHTHNPKPGLYGRVIGRLAGVPVVVNTCHGLYATSDDRWSRRGLVYGLEAIASRFSDSELIQNPEDERLLRRWRLVSPRKTRLLGNGVDLRRFDPDRIDSWIRAAIRAELGVGDGQLLVGMVGRLVVEKGYLELFEAAKALDRRYTVVVVGPDDPDKSDALSPAVVEDARRSGVRFLGHRDDLDRLYAAMDIFVLPSHREGFPRAAMEAAAMGLPVVATDIRGCREVVEDSVNGFLVPVRDPAALAGALRRLADTDLRERFGAASRRRARERFDEREVVRKVMATYAEIALRKRLPWAARLGRSLAPSPPALPGGPAVRTIAGSESPTGSGQCGHSRRESVWNQSTT